MIKGKKYPYMNKMKQINIYLPKDTWKMINKWKLTGENTSWFMRRAVSNLIGQRIKLKEKGLLEEHEFDTFLIDKQKRTNGGKT